MLGMSKYLRLLVLCLAVPVLATTTAFASTLLVTESGTFSSITPTSAISAPNGTFSISFNVSSQPTVLSSSANQFDVAYSNFSYKLNGVADLFAVGSVTFFDNLDGGLFSVCFSNPCQASSGTNHTLAFLGPQVYTDSSASPTLTPGSYANVASDAFVNGNKYELCEACQRKHQRREYSDSRTVVVDPSGHGHADCNGCSTSSFCLARASPQYCHAAGSGWLRISAGLGQGHAVISIDWA